jgi:glycosyltransferase involved in cell wall biosynthesis
LCSDIVHARKFRGDPLLKFRTNPPFRVLYDLRWMELGQAGGVEQATYELISAISRFDRKNSYQVFAPRRACWEWEFPPTFQAKRVYSDAGEPSSERFHAFVAGRHASGVGTIRGNQPAREKEAGEFEFDLVHSTCSYIHPEMIDFPGVLTIQDLQHLHHPEFFSPSELDDRERLYRESAARAKHIICGSEFTRRDVHERYGIPLGKLTTIWNIPSLSAWREIPADKRRKLLAGMGLDGPYLLYPAHGWPHKNHAKLVEAFGRAAPRLPRDLKLVLSGRPFPADHPAASIIKELGLGSRIVHVGFRSPLEFRALMQESLALVFPSLFEGFGMPVAEAIIAGKPVLCSNVTSLPEIAGDAAMTFDPRNAEEIASRIVEVATEPGLRRSLVGAATRRRSIFSAQLSAVRTLAVYESVFGHASGASS